MDFKYIVLLLVLFLAKESFGQIPPPDFLCVENDTLKWTPATVTCGAFESYTVYASQNEDGPYVVLAEVTDPTQALFFHDDANSANIQWYYYIESHHDCLGQTPVPSDTLDNRDPDFPLMDAVTVSGTDVIIYWTPSEAPETAGYVIFRKRDNGAFEPVDTVYGAATSIYVDVTGDPAAQSEDYTIIAFDECWNTSIFNSATQATIFMEYAVDPCDQSARLDWNPYKNWAEGVAAQEVWLSIDGGSQLLLDTISGQDTTYLYPGLDDGREYCFTIRAARGGGTLFFSESNTVCFQADIIQPSRELYLQNVTFDTDDNLKLTWCWEPDAELDAYAILSSEDNFDYFRNVILSPEYPLGETAEEILENHEADESKLFFQVETIDLCDTSFFSNYFSTIYLEGEARSDGRNVLSWTAFDARYGDLRNYEIHRVSDLPIDTKIGDADEGTTNFSDAIDVTNPQDGTVCYFVTAQAFMEFPNGKKTYITTRSNTVCIEQFALVQLPNAFAPLGENKIFRPLVTFSDLIVEYELSVYNRWGRKLFTSNDPENGWDGRFNGELMDQGVYAFTLKMKQSNGHVVEKIGSVMLVK